MTKAGPTLADQMIKEWSGKKYKILDPKYWLANHIGKARKFVLDQGMSTFMADLGYVSLNACRTVAKKQQLIEGMRKLARLPHAVTWIEFDKQAHRRRVKEMYHPDIVADPDSVPDRSGWLLMQHPTTETAFMAVHCTSHSWVGDTRMPVPNSSQFAYAWTCDDNVPPWPRDMNYHKDNLVQAFGDSKVNAMVGPAGILTGVWEYETECVSVIKAPHLTPEAAKLWADKAQWSFNPLGELAHDLRYLWSLLATLNELPTSAVEVRQSRGFVSKGSYKKFCDHTLLSLTIPVKRYAVTAKRAIAIARRRGHQVRGHFRVDRFHPGERIWVREHVRGDTSLGFVMHDYKISRGSKPYAGGISDGKN